MTEQEIIQALQEKRGLIATVVTSGDVKPEYSLAFSNMRDWNSRHGFVNIEYRIFDAKLVESGRDAICNHALKEGYEWLMMIDADAAAWPQEATVQMLQTAYVSAPDADVVGAYAQLKQMPYLPTIDTGTGTWEPIYPGQGLLPVIRTGGHFLFVKTSLLQRMGMPWFRTRIPMTPIKAVKDFDNFVRTQMDGQNPFRDHPEWDTMFVSAVQASVGQMDGGVHIGEDSGFCDNARAVGGRIYVDTNLVTGHVASKIIQPSDLREEFKKDTKRRYAMVGVRDYE